MSPPVSDSATAIFIRASSKREPTTASRLSSRSENRKSPRIARSFPASSSLRASAASGLRPFAVRRISTWPGRREDGGERILIALIDGADLLLECGFGKAGDPELSSSIEDFPGTASRAAAGLPRRTSARAPAADREEARGPFRYFQEGSRARARARFPAGSEGSDAPSGTIACRRLTSGISIPRFANRSRSFSRIPSSRRISIPRARRRRIPRAIVRRRAEAARDQHEIRTIQRLSDRVRDDPFVVSDDSTKDDGDTDRAELFRQVKRVGLDSPRCEELLADREYLGLHRHHLTPGGGARRAVWSSPP